MSTPFIWIVLPIIAGISLLFLQKWKTGVAIVGTLLASGLAFVAWKIPMEGTLVFGSWSTTLEDSLSFAGLRFFLTGTDRSLLITLYGTTAFILGGAIAARSQRRFVPFGLIIIGFIIAALTIEPIVYGVFFFQLIILLCVLILSPPGYKVSKGVLRYLVFQVIGLAFILFSGWLLSDSAAILNDLNAMMRASLITGLGFVFLFGIFPLYAWVTKTAEDSHPYAAMFVFSMTFGAYTLYFLSFLEAFSWMLGVIDFFALIRFMGVLMVATGGAWAAFQRNLGRLFGYAVVIEVGHSLLSLGIQSGNLHYAMLVPRLISLAVWALGLAVLRGHVQDLGYKSVQGMARQYPVASIAVLFAHFSLAGLPLLAGFPVLLSLWRQLALISTSQAVWSFLGCIGLMAGGFRSLAVLVMGPEQLNWEGTEDFLQRFYLLIGMVSILLMGIFPHWIFPLFSDLASTYTFFSP
jgi:formate hydrogenlyase subunit 3/multisubunit Na+/H+ antiporter MnhD subunit